MSQSALRTLSLLAQVVNSPMPLGLMDIAATTGLDKSTAARLLALLERQGLLLRDAETKQYDVGPAMLALAAASLRSSDLSSLARAELSTLRDETGETASLHLRLGDARVCIGGAESKYDLRRVVPVGESVPLADGPSGKVILAYLAPRTARELTQAVPLGKAAKLERQLKDARTDGYLATVDDLTVGVSALSAPLFRRSEVAGSISIAGPSSRWTEARMRAYAQRLKEVCARVSAAWR